MNPTVSERIRVLRQYFDEDYKRRDPEQRPAIYKRVFADNAEKSDPRKMALALAAFLEEKSIHINEHDLLAGKLEHYNYEDSLPIVIVGGDPRFGGSNSYDIDREVRLCLTGMGDRPEDRERLTWLADGVKEGLFIRWGSGHVIGGYEKVARLGLDALIGEGEGYLADAAAPEQRESIENMLICDRAAQTYILRYARAAGEAARQTADPAYKKTLERIARACENVAHHSPGTFFEAVQLLLLTHDVVVCEAISGSLSLGRIDQWLYPYYRTDLENGVVTEREAQELIMALWLKLARCMAGFQNVMLGGADKGGAFAGNDVSLFCLRASRLIKMDQPLLSFRYHPDMPEQFWKEILLLISTGLGFPALFNDAPIFKAKLAAGIDGEDVWNYGVVGCVEPSIGGMEYSNTEELRISWAKVLEVMLQHGQPDAHHVLTAPAEARDLDGVTSFDDFYRWYKSELACALDGAAEATNLLDAAYGDHWPVPFLSSTIEGTFPSGKDATKGGAKYSLSSINSVGMADTVDSLMAIREIVFERKLYPLSEFAAILRRNFAGDEALKGMVQKLPCKFGNDDAATDEIMTELTELVFDRIGSYRNPYGNKYQTGLYSVFWHSKMGELTGALPSGREAGKSLANALSPCQGADSNGPTAVINSVLDVDVSHCGNGMVLDLKFTPQFLETTAHRRGLRQLIEIYFERGGMEIQLNVVNRETLIDAQKNPQEYQNLIVRVSGYSAYFVYLDKTLQDEIIARTEFESFGG